jgi:hypothetical protein
MKPTVRIKRLLKGVHTPKEKEKAEKAFRLNGCKLSRPCYRTLLSGPIAQMNNACNRIVGQKSFLFILYITRRLQVQGREGRSSSVEHTVSDSLTSRLVTLSPMTIRQREIDRHYNIPFVVVITSSSFLFRGIFCCLSEVFN